MKRIMIIGGNGSGKTTLSKKLSEKWNLPLVHLDVLYWRDDWQIAPKDEFHQLLLPELMKPEWIIDGNMIRTIPLRLTYCDTVIYLDFSRLNCIWGILKRVITNYGKSRPDMGGYCPERFDRGKFVFLKSVWNFNKNNRKRFSDMLNNQDGIQIITLKNRRQADRFLETI